MSLYSGGSHNRLPVSVLLQSVLQTALIRRTSFFLNISIAITVSTWRRYDKKLLLVSYVLQPGWKHVINQLNMCLPSFSNRPTFSKPAFSLRLLLPCTKPNLPHHRGSSGCFVVQEAPAHDLEEIII